MPLAAQPPEKFKPLTMTAGNSHRQLAPKTAYTVMEVVNMFTAILTFSKLGWLIFFAAFFLLP
ncbi:MAG: hypothetical protein AAF716_00160 [Cyanobacteria bacterium P01_D01_bin.1]